MNIFFLNCGNRKIISHIESYLHQHQIDLAVLAENYNVRSFNSKEYSHVFIPANPKGLCIFSKHKIKIDELNYIIDDNRIKVNNSLHRYRVINIETNSGINIIAAHIDYGWYNNFAMREIEKQLLLNKNIEIIIGDFNSVYVNDNLDINNGGIVFQNGFLYFSEYEKIGFIDPLKNLGLYTHINNRSKRRFRIDHCFIKRHDLHVEYVDFFLENRISDHKGILVKNITL